MCVISLAIQDSGRVPSPGNRRSEGRIGTGRRRRRESERQAQHGRHADRSGKHYLETADVIHRIFLSKQRDWIEEIWQAGNIPGVLG